MIEQLLTKCMALAPVLALVAVLPGHAHGQFWQEVAIEAPDDVTADGGFGAALAVQGDLLLVGAPGSDAGAPGSGSAYLYRRNAEGLQTWGFVQRLLPPASFTGGSFGTQVMFHDGAIFISAPRERVAGITRGAIHAYRYDAVIGIWVHRQTVIPDIPQWQLAAGAGLSVAGDVLIAFAPGYDVVPTDPVPGSGALLTFLPDDGGLFQTARNVPGDLLVPTAVLPSLQGWSGGCNNSLYYVGNDAKAYSVPQEALLSSTASLPAPIQVQLSDPFDPIDPSMQILNGCTDGTSLYFIVSVQEPTPHAVCVQFEQVAGELIQQGYMVSDTANNELIWKWGAAVSTGDGFVIVGDPGDLTFTPLGYAEVFRPDPSATTRWIRCGLLLPSDPEYGARFGLTVAVGDGFAVVGAPKQGEEDRGKVYGFVDPLSGIYPLDREPGLRIYPSPVMSHSGVSTVNVDLPATAGRLMLTTIDGRFVGERAVRGPITWELVGEAAGSYVFTWRSVNGALRPRSAALVILP